MPVAGPPCNAATCPQKTPCGLQTAEVCCIKSVNVLLASLPVATTTTTTMQPVEAVPALGFIFWPTFAPEKYIFVLLLPPHPSQPPPAHRHPGSAPVTPMCDPVWFEDSHGDV